MKTSQLNAYAVFNSAGKMLSDTDDLFAALAVIKRLQPGAKLIRKNDGKTLAYTVGSKADSGWMG